MRHPLLLRSGTVDFCSLAYSFVGMAGGALWVAFIANELVGAMTIIGVEVIIGGGCSNLLDLSMVQYHIPGASAAPRGYDPLSTLPGWRPLLAAGNGVPGRGQLDGRFCKQHGYGQEGHPRYGVLKGVSIRYPSYHKLHLIRYDSM